MAIPDISLNGRTGPDSHAPADRLAALVRQLDAATAVVCGEGFASFSSLHEDIQETYLWMLHDLAARARFAQEEETEQRFKSLTAGAQS